MKSEAALATADPPAPDRGLLHEFLKGPFVLGVVNGSFFMLGSAFLSSTSVMPIFLSHLTEGLPTSLAHALIGFLSLTDTFGWYLPQFFAAGLLLHRPYKMPLYRAMALLRFVLFLTVVVSVFLLGEHHRTALLVLFSIVYPAFTISSGFAGPAFMDVVARTIRPDLHGTFFAARQILGGILAMGAGLAVSVVLPRYPWPVNFGILFALALVGFTIGLESWSLVKEPPGPATEKQPYREALRTGHRILRRDRNLRRFYTSRLLLGGFSFAAPFYPLFAMEVLGAEPATAGRFVVFSMLGFIVSNIGWSLASRRSSARTVLVLAGLAGILPPVIGVLATFGLVSLDLFAMVFFFLGATEAGVWVGYSSYLLAASSGAERPIVIGLLNTLSALVPLLGVAGGLTFTWTSYRTLFAISGLLCLAGAISSRRLDLRAR